MTLRNDLIGLDRLWETFNSPSLNNSSGYPPYNLIRNEDNYVIELAVAGFTEDQLSIDLQDNYLTISSHFNINEQKTINYVHQGIAQRNFVRKFVLGEDVVIDSAHLNSGILTINLHREIPEHKKPRKIEIQSKKLLTESKKSV
jgi:molecular chaperone IbpA